MCDRLGALLGNASMSRYLTPLSAIALALIAATPAAALTSKECSTKYQAAKQAGTLGSMKWNDFRKAECGAETAPTTTTVPNPMAPTQAAKPSPAPAPTPAPAAAGGSAVFPRAVDQKYSSLAAGKGRMQTCLDQYNANKAATNGAGNGGMKWIQKGGGYYSACNKALKG